MNRLLALTTDVEGRPHALEITVHRGERPVHRYVFMEILGQLIHYRHETFPEDDARRLLV